jgi:cation diffusion facilitator family transporter
MTIETRSSRSDAPGAGGNTATTPLATTSTIDTKNLERWGWYSIGVSLFLTILNLMVATASGSAAAQAEMVHNLTDGLASVAVLLGLKVSNHRSPAFPYGLYKAENVVAVVLGGLILFTAYDVAHDALTGQVLAATVNGWMLAGVALSMVVPVLFSSFEMKAGKAANSPSLIAQAKEYRTHVVTSGMVLVVLAAQRLTLPLDLIAALVIVVAFGKTGLELLVDGLRVLLDASIEDEVLEQIQDLIKAEPTVAHIRWIATRNAGRCRFVDMCVALRVHELDLAEEAVHRIESRIREAVPHVERVLVQANPMTHTHVRYGVPLEDAGGTISLHFGDAPFFALTTIRQDDGTVAEQHVAANTCLENERGKGLRVAEWLVDQKIDAVILRATLRGSGPYYCFAYSGIKMLKTEALTLQKALEHARLGKLDEELIAPPARGQASPYLPSWRLPMTGTAKNHGN